MVIVRRRKLKGRTYYYLEHSIRKGDKVWKKEIYLGTKVPADIDALKAKFGDSIFREKWYPDIDRIRKKFLGEQKALPASVKEKELLNFAVRFTYDTQKIEGSTLTRRETADLLERQISPAERSLRDVKEAEAHRDLFYEILDSRKDLLRLNMVLDWHWKLFNQTKPDIAGKIRNYQVATSGSKFMPPSPVEVLPMLTDFFHWYNTSRNKVHPLELAAIAHLKFVTIHPFGDGNGRVSRLVMNFILNKKDYPMVDIPYESRNRYYNALERSQTTNQGMIILRWFTKNYVKENRRYLS
jgi:Fic family protein